MFMPRHLVFACAAVIGFTTPLVAAERETVEDFITVSGLGLAVDAYQTEIAAIPNQMGKGDTTSRQAFSKYATEAFEPASMRAALIDQLIVELPQDAAEAALAFYSTPFGVQVVALESEALAVDRSKMIEEGGALLRTIITEESPRLDAYFRLIAASVPVDRTIDFTMDVQVKMLTVFGVPGQEPGAIPENQIREAVAGSRPQIEQGVVGETLTRFAYTYQNLSDEDLLRYTEALEKPQVKAAIEATGSALFDVTGARLVQVAEKMMADLQ